MQVTHVQDHVTHANISGAKAIDFGISDSAEFFNILSSTLYSDQILAVVRETLCNAWDAHIEFGCTDKPVEITLTKEELKIRDHGPGIPGNMMGPIYGTYGGSTKASNGQVTGGFGLGCKSPFAYTDYFDVTSWSKEDGKMTVYSLSKSNAEVGGKPSILPIVSVPTIEHGLEVKIMLKQGTDMARFKELIERIVQNGQMNMTLNGKALSTLPFDTMVHDFLLTKAKVIETNQQILLRYGNVIYPIEDHEDFHHYFLAVADLLNKLPKNNYGGHSWKIIFQAKPNSISVTPSREALSMQKHTIASIVELLKSFVDLKNRELVAQCNTLLDTNIENTFLTNTPITIFEPEQKIPGLARFNYLTYDEGKSWNKNEIKENFEETHLVDFSQFVRAYASYSYPDFKGFRKRDIKARFKMLIASGYGRTKAIKALKREFDREEAMGAAKHGLRASGFVTSWFQKEIIWPIISKMTEEPGVRKEKLFVYGKKNHDRWGHGDLGFHPWKSYPAKTDLVQYLPFLRNHIILSFNRLDIDRASKFPVMKYWLGSTENSLVYIVPRAERKVAAARAFFESLGLTVVDLTVAQKWENKAAASAPVPEYKQKPRRNGIPRLDSIMRVGILEARQNRISTELASSENATLIKTPEFVVKFNRKNDQHHLDNLTGAATQHIVNLWGTRGGIVVNENQYKKYIEAGAMNMRDFALDHILHELQTNQRIINSLPFAYERHPAHADRYHGDGEALKWFEMIWADPDLKAYFEMDDLRNDEDMKLFDLYKEFKSNYWRGEKKQMDEIEKILNAVKLSPKIDDLINRIKRSKMMILLDRYNMRNAMKNASAYGYQPKQRLAVRDMLLNCIEG